MASLNRGNFYIPSSNTALVVVDFQEKLVPAINNSKQVIEAGIKAIKISNALNIPVIVTEQVPDKMGKTISEINEFIDTEMIIAKSDFSCFGEKTFCKRLDKLNIENILICGVEAHVCVLQTALDALAANYGVYIVTDSVGSRDPKSVETAFTRMSAAGIHLVTTEMVLFEWIERYDCKAFKALRELIV